MAARHTSFDQRRGGTSDQTIATATTVAAGSLAVGTTLLRVRAGGTMDSIATSGTFTFRIKVGASLIAFNINAGTTGAQTGKTWFVDADLTVNATGVSGAVSIIGTALGITATGAVSTIAPTAAINQTRDLSSGLIVVLSASFTTGNAGNVILTQYASLTQLA